MHDTTPVCQLCGSPDIRMSDKHGWVICDDCGEDGPSMQYGDWITGQETPHMIPDGYAEA